MENDFFTVMMGIVSRGYSLDIRKDTFGAAGLKISIISDIEPRKKYTFVQTYHDSANFNNDLALLYEVNRAIDVMEMGD